MMCQPRIPGDFCRDDSSALRGPFLHVIAVAVSVLNSFGSISPAASAIPDSPAAFARMPVDQARSLLLQWIVLSRPEKSVAEKVTALWADDNALRDLTAEETLDRVIQSFSLVDESARELLESHSRPGPLTALNFEGNRSDSFYRNQVSLYQARWLTQHRYYDEAIGLLEALDPADVVDPAGLFFYRATCRLRLLKTADAGDDITLLLNHTLDVPSRFRLVAELMKQEIGLNEDGLPQVARLMSDVQRRLDLGKADEPVQKRGDDVIAALDKLLKEMEQQQQQQDQQQSSQDGGGQQNQSGDQALSQSRVKGSSAAGEADRRDVSESGSWGMLDKQAEAQARELIRQQFPANFLDAISRYTRRIAEQKK